MRIIFLIQKSKACKGFAPIYLRIRDNHLNQTSQISTGIKTKIDKWNSAAQKINGRDEAVQIANQKLLVMKNKIQKILLDLELKGELVTTKIVKDIFTGKRQKSYKLMDILREYKEKNSFGIAPSTAKKYDRYMNYVNNYLVKKNY